MGIRNSFLFQLGLGVIGLFSITAFAGQYTNNFNSYALNATNFGDGSILFSSVSNGVVARVEDSSLFELQLSEWDVTSNRSAFLLPDLDPGKSIHNFKASWISPVYGNFPNAGDGFSFNFGPLRTTNLVSTNVLQELGYGTGLTLSMRTGSSSPGMSLFCNGILVAGPVTNNPTATWGVFSATRHTFQVNWIESSGVSVSMDGATIFTNVVLTNYTASAGDSFVWAAHAGTYGETYRIDNATVTTSLGAPLLQSVITSNPPAMPQANLSAQVHPNGLPTTVIIDFGTNLSYGTSVTNLLPATNDFVPFATSFPNLAVYPTMLHARLTVSNALGTVTSGDLAFNGLLFQKTYSGDFLGQGTTYLEPVAGAVTWLDFNNDGLLDLAVSGQITALASRGYIYYNQGTNQTRWPYIQTPNGFKSSLAVGDLDNDNRPDVFFATGLATDDQVAHVTSIYNGASGILFGSDNTYGTLNGPAGTAAKTNMVLFTSPTGQAQTGSGLYIYDSTTVMCDLDHDGRQDLLVSGWRNVVTDSGVISHTNFSAIYWNNYMNGKRPTATLAGYPTNTMTPVNTSVPGLGIIVPLGGWDYFGQNSLAISDLNSDGLPDLFCAGLLNQLNIGKADKDYGAVYLGDGDGGFTQTAYYAFDNTEATEVDNQSTESSALADLNGDGKPDLVFSFFSGDDYRTHASIRFNDGTGNFTNSGIVLPHLELMNVATGDLFNHGRNDIILSGYVDMISPNGAYANPSGQTFILRNDGGGVFTTFDLGLIGTSCEQGTGVKLADYDNDGRLDIAMAGGYWGANVTHILRNVIGNIPSNAPPTAPTGLTTTVGPGTVNFHWNQAADDITPVNQLTYNLRVGTNSLGTQTVSPVADVVTGWRKIAQPGNCWSVTNTTYHFPPGTYFWSVQAVDGGFKGGAWGTEQTFTITDSEPVKLIYAQNGGTNNLTWSLRHRGYTVETKGTLNDAAWVSNAVNVDTFNGKWNVPGTNSAGSGFYRLRK